jgi:hypothetical protein
MPAVVDIARILFKERGTYLFVESDSVGLPSVH